MVARTEQGACRLPRPGLRRGRPSGACSAGWLVIFLVWLCPLPGDTAGFQNGETVQVIMGQGARALLLPTDVAVHGERVAVVDGGHRRIVLYDMNGRYLGDFGDDGDEPLQAPVGLDIDPVGRFLVADRARRQIVTYSPQGHRLHAFAVPERPIDVAISRDGRELFVTTNRRHEVRVYSPRGRLLRHWGGNGDAAGEFRYPATLAVLAGRRLAVVDVFNTRVQIFERSGEFLFHVGSWGVRPGRLFRPKGVAVDRRGRIYVSDSYLDVVQIFDADGAFRQVLSTGKHRLITPTGLAVDAADRLYVAEPLANRISLFPVPDP